MKWLWVLLGGIIALVSCGDRHAGGGPSGTEAGNALTLALYQVNGTPAAKIQAIVRDAEYGLDSNAVFQRVYVSDSLGQFRLDSLPQGLYLLEAMLDTAGIWLPISVDSSSKDLGKDTLRPLGSISGVVSIDNGVGTFIFPGTERRVSPLSDGSYTEGRIPSGPVRIVWFRDSVAPMESYIHVLPNTDITPPIWQYIDTDRLLLDDFNDSNSQHSYGPWFGEGWWWITASEGVGISPGWDHFPSGYDPLHRAFVHFSASFDTGATDAWLDLGVQIGLNNRGYNLEEVDSLAFEMRGGGELHIFLRDFNGDLGADLDYIVPAPNEWTRFSIPLDSIRNERKNIRAISWVVIRGADISLDNVELIGATKNEIWGW